MNFEACLALPRDPREAALLADNLEALARALREWPVEAWIELALREPSESDGLFQRLAVHTAEAALDALQRARATDSAEAVAGVLRVLWPDGDVAPNQLATAASGAELTATWAPVP
jgi:hypothetical protein